MNRFTFLDQNWRRKILWGLLCLAAILWLHFPSDLPSQAERHAHNPAANLTVMELAEAMERFEGLAYGPPLASLGGEAYRLKYYPAFRTDTAYAITLFKEWGKISLTHTKSRASSPYGDREVIFEERMQISPTHWQSLMRALERTHFWSFDNFNLDDRAYLDAANWTLEAYKPRYFAWAQPDAHFVARGNHSHNAEFLLLSHQFVQLLQNPISYRP